MLDSPGQIALLRERESPGDLSLNERGSDCECLLIVRNRLIDLPLAYQCEPPIGVDVGEVRSGLERRLKVFDRFVRLTLM